MFESFKTLKAYVNKPAAERTAADLEAVNAELKSKGLDMVLVASVDHASMVASAEKVTELTSKVDSLTAEATTLKSEKEALTSEKANLTAEVERLGKLAPESTTSKKDGEDDLGGKQEEEFPLSQADIDLAAERKRLGINSNNK